jgi:hypothetical protein
MISVKFTATTLTLCRAFLLRKAKAKLLDYTDIKSISNPFIDKKRCPKSLLSGHPFLFPLLSEIGLSAFSHD